VLLVQVPMVFAPPPVQSVLAQQLGSAVGMQAPPVVQEW
jgi:hypothetical protein